MDKKKKKKMMYGGSARKNMKHGGPHKKMDRIGMAMGGAMEVQNPNENESCSSKRLSLDEAAKWQL